MFELMAWVEGSALGQAVRGAGVWTYGLINLAHILGIATLFGAVLALDLRMLGVWRSIPLAMVARPTVPLAAAGFVLAALSGVCMITVNTTEYHGNPFLYIKLPVIALALLNVAVVQRLPAWRHARLMRGPAPGERRQLAVAGGVSLVLWLAAISAGRMIGYW